MKSVQTVPRVINGTDIPGKAASHLVFFSPQSRGAALVCTQQHSTFLKRERKRTRTACPDTVSPRDPLLAYKKPELVACLRQAQVRCTELETQQAALLVDYVQKNVKIAELEAELARCCEYFEGPRLQVQWEEHEN